MSIAEERRRAQQELRRRAAWTDGIVTRRQLREAGVSRGRVRADVAAGRLVPLGRRALSAGPGDPVRRRWRTALADVGPAAALGGVTALQHAGLQGVQEDQVHVVVPKSSRPGRPLGVRVHESRRFREEDVVSEGLRHVRPAAAAVQAALWARTDKEAALVLVAPLQQRLCSVDEVVPALALVHRHARRGLLWSLLDDVRDGSESLGELDLARMCRTRGLPLPDRQVVRRLPSGRAVLDALWSAYRVVVEVDGVQHRQGEALLRDALRDNDLRLSGHVVLRVPVVALRSDPEPFLRQLERGLVDGGWRRRD